MISIITFTKAPRLKLFIIVIVVLLAAILMASFAWPKTSEAPTSKLNNPLAPGYYTVTYVVDGDTIKVDIDEIVETVRLIGIDAPELPNNCFAQEAKTKAQSFLSGQQVKLEADKSQDNRDRYGRLLRYVILEDGTNFNQLMVAKGYAREFTFITPYKFQSEFKKAQATAKKNKLGLWLPNICI